MLRVRPFRLAVAVLALVAGMAHAAPPRLWEAVRPDNPDVHVYILAAGADPADGYFDRIVIPAATAAHVLHQAAGAGEGIVACEAGQSGCGASDRGALLRAASASPAAGNGCARANAWLGEIGRMADGRTHFVIADVAPAAGCRDLLGRLAEAGFVLWPVAEFRTDQAWH